MDHDKNEIFKIDFGKKDYLKKRIDKTIFCLNNETWMVVQIFAVT